MTDTYEGESNDMSGMTEQPAAASLNELAGTLDAQVASALDRALAGEDITAEEGTLLFGTTGPEYNATVLVADELRRRTVGDVVTYVVNRNINFTNVCIKRCGFCAFSRDFREEEGYFLPIEEIVRRAREAWDYGATEVCIQAGLPPQMERRPVHQALRRHQGSAAGYAHSRVLARGSAVRLCQVAVFHPGVP